MGFDEFFFYNFRLPETVGWPEVSAIEQFTIIWSNITHLNWNLHEVSAILPNHVQDTGEIEISYLILVGVKLLFLATQKSWAPHFSNLEFWQSEVAKGQLISKGHRLDQNTNEIFPRFLP